MSLKHSPADNAKRRHWMAILARTEVSQLQALMAALPNVPQYSLPRPVETGLAMVRGRISVSGEPFNLGETTVTRCVIQLEDNTTGVAYVIGRDKQQAECAAVIDALFQNQSIPLSCLEPLENAIKNKRHNRAEEVASTKVDFFTLVRGED